MGKTRMEIVEIEIDSINIKQIFRKDFGDLSDLMEEIAAGNLRHAITVDSNNNLICGKRRLEAFKRLGIKTIPATISNPEEPLMAQLKENTCRKDYTPSEMVELTDAIRNKVEREAALRQHKGLSADGKAGGRSRQKNPTANDGKVLSKREGQTLYQLAKAVGTSEGRLNKAWMIVHDAYKNPETFNHIVNYMDRTGNVNRAYQMYRELIVPAQPGKEEPTALEKDFAKAIRKCLQLINAMEKKYGRPAKVIAKDPVAAQRIGQIITWLEDWKKALK